MGSVFADETSERTPTAHFIVVTHGQANDPFWLRVKNGVEEAAAAMGVTVDYRAPETFDMVAMAQLIEAAIQQEPDGLVVSVPDADALSAAVKKAIQAGIPVASINSGGAMAKTLGTLFHVGSDEFKAGIAAGKQMRDAGVRNLICVNHEVGNVSLDIRCQGVSAGYGKPVKVIPSPANSVEAVYATVKATLQANEDIDGIIALGATMVAEPTLKVMAELGRTDIKLGSFDLSPRVLNGVKTGAVAFAIDQQQFLQGYLPIVHLSLYHRYQLVPPKSLPSGPGLVTPETALQVVTLSGQGIR
jgi:simple sugar transport system substrate-binding protein